MTCSCAAQPASESWQGLARTRWYQLLSCSHLPPLTPYALLLPPLRATGAAGALITFASSAARPFDCDNAELFADVPPPPASSPQGYWSGWGFGTWCNNRKLHDRTVVTIDGEAY